MAALAILVAGLVNAMPTDGGVAPVEATPHLHEPIQIDLPPVVTRVAVSLSQPRRLLVDGDGTAYVADWGGGKVLQIAPDGRSEVLAHSLHEPAGLARDAAGNVFVALHAGGVPEAGSILRIGQDSTLDRVADGLTGPTALAFDPSGTLYVANYHDGSIVTIGLGGATEEFAGGLAGPAAIAFDRDGTLYCACSVDGTIVRFGRDGTQHIVARDLPVPSDIAFDTEGRLVAVCYGRSELIAILPNGQKQPYAIVPAGTIAVAFDRPGRLWLANWDQAVLLQVTAETSIRCPHCGQPIRLRFQNPPVIPVTRPPKDEPVIENPSGPHGRSIHAAGESRRGFRSWLISFNVPVTAA